jgi:flagellin-specific chaperone FliS
MMTQQEIFREVVSLPFREQAELIEKISRNLKQGIAENGNQKIEDKELSIAERIAIVESLAGSLKMENPPMTKEEDREVIYQYLSEKYK